MIFSALLFLFIVMPMVELALLVKIGGLLGVGPTIAIVILTGTVGAALARQQGAKVLRDAQREMNQGRTPGPLMIDGVLILVAGLLLITPGVLTDAFGFLLLIPVTRREIRVWLRRCIERKMQAGSLRVRRGGPPT